MKILIISDCARSGKDTLAEIWRDEFGLTFKSSSYAAAEIFIFDRLKDEYGYKTIEECFQGRLDPAMRVVWHDLICEYNKDDKARLAKDILKKNDCYVGMRSIEEIEECLRQKIFDVVIFVDAGNRVEKESKKSNQVTKDHAHIVVMNDTDLETFRTKAIYAGSVIFTKTLRSRFRRLVNKMLNIWW